MKLALAQPRHVSVPMVVLVLLVPVYLIIPDYVVGPMWHVPELALDRMVPLQPSWSLVYLALYFFLILLPLLVVRQREHIDRTVYAYLTIWLSAYVCFLVYPTVAPRATEVAGDGFGLWLLGELYRSDVPYNCFPSLHVAHSFVSALTCYRIHARLGVVAIVCACLVAASTLFTKQHYFLDVVAGIGMALAVYAIFLRRCPRPDSSELDYRAAPWLAVVAGGVIGLCFFGIWVAYILRGAT